MSSTHTYSPQFRAPSLSLLATEPLRAAFDFFSSKLASRAEQVGDGHSVIVFPGLGGAAFTTSHLRNFLIKSGFDAHDWGGGINTGPKGVFDDWLGNLQSHTNDSTPARVAR
ncbi:MAG TPA: hypothetical protein VE934_06140 [Polaromonas sp.]|uniref:hypothetical protein n=1 Tax=Polaromonas sp. TaxID=1869339 RepID=UPI002D2F9C59|nr:hypothetical protein [Polaromonas sp.]HYW56517.1 hypothetical protein [Polaromonas sp.]